MPKFALSSIGRDRPGIVAEISKVLLEHGMNIEDSQMTILRGHFTMMLIVTGPESAGPARLRADLEHAGKLLGLDAVSVSELSDTQPPPDAAASASPAPSHVISVYGVDHPGIVHAVSVALADCGISITDLRTRLVHDEGADALYALMLEVAHPGDVGIEELRKLLEPVSDSEGVEVTIHALEPDTL